MTALDRTAAYTGEPEYPAQASLRPGTVHRLGEYATVRLVADGPAPVSVVVTGEIDLTCADEFAAVLCAALDAYPQGIVLDLASVEFCDCRGLRALLVARAAAQHRGRHFSIGPYSPIVARLFELTETRFILTSPLTSQR